MSISPVDLDLKVSSKSPSLLIQEDDVFLLETFFMELNKFL